MLGYISAFISSLFFSLYIIPRKLSNLSPVIFSFLMSIGFFLSTLILYLFKPIINFQDKPSLVLLLSVIAGIIWAGSFVSFVLSIDIIGLSRSNQWKNLQGPVGVILALLILNEFALTNPFFVILAALSIFISAVFFTRTTSLSQKQFNIKGIYFACLSALGFGTVATIQKYVTTNVGIYLQQVIWSFSIMLSLFIYVYVTRKIKEIIKSNFKDIVLSLLAGFIYLGASLFQLFSYNYIPASIGFTIIQLNAFWTITIGIVFFKEIDLKRHYREVIFGFIFTLLGILFLVFSKK